MNNITLQQKANDAQKDIFLYRLLNGSIFASFDRFKKGEKLSNSTVEKMITVIAFEKKASK